MFFLWLLSIIGGGVIGWGLCIQHHDKKVWKCFCRTTDQYKHELDAIREERHRIEAEQVRHVLPSGVYR